MCNSSKRVDDMWILDSACSYHICYIREFFHSFSESDGSVFMGNDQPCRIEGIGSIKIQMFDGVVRTLTNVRYIPDMRKNLISLGILDTKGLEWSTRKGVLQVQASDKIIMKGNKHRNLYVLEGNTVCGEVNVTRSRPEMAHVWHSRLGHMSDRYLTMLREKDLLSGLG